MTMTMPRASASVIPDHDSVEDFASPLKKFKVDKDLVGEQHTTDSVENDKDFAKLKDLVGEEEEDNTPVPMSQDSEAAAVMKLTSLEAFKIWCEVYGKEYPNDKEKQSRFQIFERSLVKNTPFIPGALTFPSLADQTEEEFNEFCEKHDLQKYGQPMNNSISTKQIIYLRNQYLIPEDPVPKDNTTFPTHLY